MFTVNTILTTQDFTQLIQSELTLGTVNGVVTVSDNCPALAEAGIFLAEALEVVITEIGWAPWPNMAERSEESRLRYFKKEIFVIAHRLLPKGGFRSMSVDYQLVSMLLNIYYGLREGLVTPSEKLDAFERATDIVSMIAQFGHAGVGLAMEMELEQDSEGQDKFVMTATSSQIANAIMSALHGQIAIGRGLNLSLALAGSYVCSNVAADTAKDLIEMIFIGKEIRIRHHVANYVIPVRDTAVSAPRFIIPTL